MLLRDTNSAVAVWSDFVGEIEQKTGNMGSKTSLLILTYINLLGCCKKKKKINITFVIMVIFAPVGNGKDG